MLGRGGEVLWGAGSPIGHGTESDSVESNSGKVRRSVDLCKVLLSQYSMLTIEMRLTQYIRGKTRPKGRQQEYSYKKDVLYGCLPSPNSYSDYIILIYRLGKCRGSMGPLHSPPVEEGQEANTFVW